MKRRTKIGDRLKIIRVGLNLTQAELAKALSVTPQTVSGIERGTQYINVKTLSFLADNFHVNINYLIFNSEDRFIGDYTEESARRSAKKYKA